MPSDHKPECPLPANDDFQPALIRKSNHVSLRRRRVSIHNGSFLRDKSRYRLGTGISVPAGSTRQVMEKRRHSAIIDHVLSKPLPKDFNPSNFTVPWMITTHW